MNITREKAFRREQLAKLMDEVGQTELSEMTKVKAAYLFQMAKGEGKSRRGISDAMVAKIEAAMRRPGWFSQENAPQILMPASPKSAQADWVGIRWGGSQELSASQQKLWTKVLLFLDELPDGICEAINTLVEHSVAVTEINPHLSAKTHKPKTHAQKAHKARAHK